MRRPRRNHSPAFKAKAALRGDKTLTELAQQFDLHPNQITQWRQRLLQASAEVFVRSEVREPPVCAAGVARVRGYITSQYRYPKRTWR